jgi:hypothetical protein
MFVTIGFQVSPVAFCRQGELFALVCLTTDLTARDPLSLVNLRLVEEWSRTATIVNEVILIQKYRVDS